MTSGPTSDTTTASSRVGAGGDVRRRVLLVGAAVLGVVVLLVAVLWTVQRDRVLPNTSLGGVEVGGMTADEAATAIAEVARDRETDTVVFTFEEERFELSPTDLDYTIDDDLSVEAALARGRSNPATDLFVRLGALVRARDVALVERVPNGALTGAVDEVADEVDRDRFAGAVTADPETLEVTVEPPLGTAEVRRDDAVVDLARALRTPGPDELELPADVGDPAIPPADVDAVAAQLEAAIAEPLELDAGGDALAIEPEQLAALIAVVEADTGDALELEVAEESVDEIIGDAAREVFDVAPADASYTTSRTPPASFDAQGSTTWSPVSADVGVEGGSDGLAFDLEDAAGVLTDAVREAERTATTELEVTEPELSDARAQELQPTHLLGTFTTYYTAGQVRNANIQRLADVVDDTTVLPGDEFSINDISGERTCAKGYQPAGTIVRGELVDTCGGGVSQFGTTTFNAAFFSAVQLDQWQAHSFYISRYPQGREATLSFPQLDVRFTNDTDGAIVVRASYTGTSVTVSLYGQPTAESVSASHGSPYNQRSPTTQTRDNPSLPSGQTRTIQSAGSAGFTVQVVRRIDRLDGGQDEQTITTVYQPQNAIVERGTGAAPAATPSPAPSPDPTPPPDEDDDGGGDGEDDG